MSWAQNNQKEGRYIKILLKCHTITEGSSCEFDSISSSRFLWLTGALLVFRSNEERLPWRRLLDESRYILRIRLLHGLLRMTDGGRWLANAPKIGCFLAVLLLGFPMNGSVACPLMVVSIMDLSVKLDQPHRIHGLLWSRNPLLCRSFCDKVRMKMSIRCTKICPDARLYIK